jgi:hypothetical protein
MTCRTLNRIPSNDLGLPKKSILPLLPYQAMFNQYGSFDIKEPLSQDIKVRLCRNSSQRYLKKKFKNWTANVLK